MVDRQFDLGFDREKDKEVKRKAREKYVERQTRGNVFRDVARKIDSDIRREDLYFLKNAREIRGEADRARLLWDCGEVTNPEYFRKESSEDIRRLFLEKLCGLKNRYRAELSDLYEEWEKEDKGQLRQGYLF